MIIPPIKNPRETYNFCAIQQMPLVGIYVFFIIKNHNTYLLLLEYHIYMLNKIVNPIHPLFYIF